jgi:hypothetical protein
MWPAALPERGFRLRLCRCRRYWSKPTVTWNTARVAPRAHLTRRSATTLACAVDVRTKSDFEAIAVAVSKINDATREAVHFIERDNVPFAVAALRLGDEQLRELVDRYHDLVHRLGDSPKSW